MARKIVPVEFSGMALLNVIKDSWAHSVASSATATRATQSHPVPINILLRGEFPGHRHITVRHDASRSIMRRHDRRRVQRARLYEWCAAAAAAVTYDCGINRSTLTSDSH